MPKPTNKNAKIIARSVEDKIALRLKILNAAREIAVAEGFSQLTIRRLAKSVGYVPGTIYLYFRNRDELIRDICREAFGSLYANMREASVLSATAPRERATALLRAYAAFAINNPETYRLTFMEDPKFTDEIFRNAPLDEENGAGKQALEFLVNAFRQMKENDEIPKDEDEQLLAEVFWTAIHGIVSLKLIYPAVPFNSVEKLVDKAIESLMKGILK